MPHVYADDHRHDLPPAEVTLLLGGKAANLGVMATQLGLPVPPAFTISTGACRAYLGGGWPDGLDDEIRDHMARLEQRVGRRFGDPADPLLVSVRSGAPRSMPGMMDTILNLGLNHETEAGLAASSGDPVFARACRDRFEATYRDVVGVPVVPADPWSQLRGAIEAVFRSWNGDRARVYREREGIPDALGTGVTIQAMVFGNRGADSGTGVLFTRNPATGERRPYGDVLFNAQGEDVVAGTHATATIDDLARAMPAVATELLRHADALERHYRDCCDIEFTIERGRLWLLQTRIGKRTPAAAVRMAVDMAGEPGIALTPEEAVRRVLPYLADPPTTVAERGETGPPLARGLGASPGLVSGEIRVSPDEAVAAADRGADVILVRAETSPDDVHGMSRSRGILTSTGGFASHAAVVARGWGIPAVVGAEAVTIVGDALRIGDRTLPAGAVITIDGTTGEVFEGVTAGVEVVVPEARVLLDWARDLGFDVSGDTGPDPVASAPGAGTSGMPEQAGPDDALRALLVRDYQLPETLAPAAGCTGEVAASLLEGLCAAGLAEPGAGSFRLTAGGKAAGARLLATDAAALGAERATAALDAFVVLDRRLKQLVTAWQMRDPSTPNDHADAAYDAALIGRLADLHGEVEAWLAPLAEALPRLRRYRHRLGAAVAAARAGNGKFVASPRVDSYHTAWFELHQDLILLAGRTREQETAAGRA